jgi:toxin YhaV
VARRGPSDQRRFNGWRVLFNEPFTTAYGDLSAKSRKLKSSLGTKEFQQHPDVKLFSALYRVIYEVVPDNPSHPDFRLEGQLRKFRRVKGKGLPARLRLFFIFMQSTNTMIFLYINDRRSLRKEGDSKDPYERFSRLVQQGVIGSDFDENYKIWTRR